MPEAKISMTDIDWLLDEEHGFALYFRPRCGSTTLTRWFFENKGVKFGGFSISAYRTDWFKENYAHLASVLDERYEALHKFVVVRDPIERCVSSYLHVVNNVHDGQWNVLKPHVASNLEKHDLTFRQWVDYLQQIDLDKAHIIWRRQSALTCWNRGVDDVVPLMDLNDYLLKMNERFGLTAQPTFNSVTVPEKEKVLFAKSWFKPKKIFSDTPFRELLKFKGKAVFEQFPDYSHFYDNDLQAAVNRIYAQDIRIYTAATTATKKP